MSAERKPDLHLEIAHVLFIDVVGYSKLLADEQSETLQILNQIVRGTAEFRTAEEKGELIRLPTGDGMALVYLTKPEAPVQCALEISKAIKSYPELQLRMGIHSGSVNQIRDVNDRLNVTGAGINTAQRVMDCGDAGHILLSRRVAEDLEQYRLWQPHLHDLGECEVKHGVRVHVFNLYTDEIGNRDVPAKLKPIAQEPPPSTALPKTNLWMWRWLMWGCVVAAGLLALLLVVIILQRRSPPGPQANVPTPVPTVTGAPTVALPPSAPVEIGKPLDLPALAQKARGAVVLIMGYDAAGKIIKTGSGFFVSAEGRLVTNCHVIEGIVNAQAKLESGAIYNIDGVLASSSALDLAVLKAGARDMQFLLVDDASNPPQPGSRIAVIGSPLALEGSLSEGIVSANRSGEDGSWLQISASISPGSSGSPVLDRYGRVVGVVTWVAKEGQNLNFARSSHDLWNFLQTINQDAKPQRLSEKKDQILSDPDFIAAKEANGRGDGAAALKLLNALTQRYPNEPRLLFQFAYAYETLGLHDEAYRSWRAYIDIDPTDPAAWRSFAIAAANLNRISEAINAYKQTLKMKPDADTWRLLGDLYDAQGQGVLGAHAHDEAKRLETEKKAPSPASAPVTEDTEVGRLFAKWLSASNAGDTEQEASLYAEPADYLDFRMLSRQELVQELQKDLQRWPKQHYTVSKEPLVEKLSGSEWRVTFAIDFDVRDSSKGKQVTGTANLTWLIRRRESGELEIASSKEQVTSSAWHDIKRGGPPAQISPSQPSTPTPEQAPLLKNGRTWQAWIGDFVRQFVAVNQSKDANATVALYAPTVDYFDDHKADQAFIRQDIEKYNERWPVRRDSIEGDVHLQEKVPDKDYVASFKLNFYAESPPRQIWTKGQFAIDLDITIVDGEPKISGIREKMLHQQKGKPGQSVNQNAARKGYPSGIPVPGKAGFVRSPYAPSKGEIDIRRYPKGTAVKCPFTGKIFVVP